MDCRENICWAKIPFVGLQLHFAISFSMSWLWKLWEILLVIFRKRTLDELSSPVLLDFTRILIRLMPNNTLAWHPNQFRKILLNGSIFQKKELIFVGDWQKLEPLQIVGPWQTLTRVWLSSVAQSILGLQGSICRTMKRIPEIDFFLSDFLWHDLVD